MIGDVVAAPGREFLSKKLHAFKSFKKIDLCIVNGENSADADGITPASAQELFDAGADVVTTGNHVFKHHPVYEYLDENPAVVRPANYPAACPGKGYCIVDRGSYRAAVVNLAGVAYMMDTLENPFFCIDRLLDGLKEERVRVICVDFHAEATSEKKAMGYYLDGKVSVVAGTHTHVQTSDAAVMRHGTGYITDLGMTGNIDSVLGVDAELIIQKMKYNMPVRFVRSAGVSAIEGCIFDVDEKNGRCRSAEAVRIV